eukprot:CAMPEP_0170843550 /NCGR_PEP_ID=MMETSP0734-20130129/6330_1 /TAXON_ID=186038 /ORGANISM="Fragilariopsis kerguelensis, Strain L26-C5" /LENGTH=473 /DNA_ID=CAMNT_0011211751 /DNA_START=190 /DNA_END=1611 /DNA_ORIENTATION=+
MGCAESKDAGVVANPKKYGGSVTTPAVKKPLIVTKDNTRKTIKQGSSSSWEKEEPDNPAALKKKTTTNEAPSQHRIAPKRASLLALEGGDTHHNAFYATAHLVDSEMGKKFKQVYTLGETLGAGAFSTVREGIKKEYDAKKMDPNERDNPASYAIKIVRKENLTPFDEGALMNEIEILKEVGMYQHIIRLYDVFEEKRCYYLVTEKMSGGELYDRIIMKEQYNENEARNVSETLLAALGYCHSRRVAHRDLKPANLLMNNQEDDASIKIADFGFAKRVRTPKSLSTQCGTPQYVAPEVLSGQLYDTQADMWSIGIIIFTLLVGHPPFENDNLNILVKLIQKGVVDFDPQLWKHHSKECKNLVSNLLVVDPDQRFDARKALLSAWIHADEEVLQEIDLSDNLKVLTKFNAKRKFKAAVKAVVATKKMELLMDCHQADLDLNAGELQTVQDHEQQETQAQKAKAARDEDAKYGYY